MIEVGDYPLGVATTPNPEFMAFTNYADDQHGVGFLLRKALGWELSHYVDLTLGPHDDSFDVSSARDIVFTPDGAYAFVAGYNVVDSEIPSRNHGFATGTSKHTTAKCPSK